MAHPMGQESGKDQRRGGGSGGLCAPNPKFSPADTGFGDVDAILVTFGAPTTAALELEHLAAQAPVRSQFTGIRLWQVLSWGQQSGDVSETAALDQAACAMLPATGSIASESATIATKKVRPINIIAWIIGLGPLASSHVGATAPGVLRTSRTTNRPLPPTERPAVRREA